jgi:hypothetical protein
VSTASRQGLRLLLRVLGAALFLTGAWLAATRPPHFTWLNAGLSIDYPPAAAAWAMAAAAAALVTSLSLRPGPRLAGTGVAALALVFALQLVRYQVAVADSGLKQRGLFGTTTLPWRQVTRVESGTRVIVVWGSGGDAQVRVEAAAFAAEDRARFERTLARRIKEAAAP